ncbi:MOSC domain-containing protein [Mucilaginibacter koreensis]
MLTLSQIFIYPVKSLGGVALQEAEVTDRGLQYDRRWMLIDDNNTFLSQRSHPAMALFGLQLADDGFEITYKPDGSMYTIPFQPVIGSAVTVSIWDDTCTAMLVDTAADVWFSQKLNLSCRLVYMSDDAHRPVDHRYAKNNEQVSFADAYPFLIIGQASLNELNSRLAAPVEIDRFRPNLVFEGGEAHAEDMMGKIKIGSLKFYGVKPCARCVMIGINQQSGQSGKEPTKTLAGYRTRNHKIYFGQNLLHQGEGKISVGDEIQVTRTKPDFMLQPAEVPLYSLLTDEF